MSTANELSCGNCGVSHGEDDIFCENCGYDFITGSLPGAAEQFGAPQPGSTSSVPPDASPPVMADAPTSPAPGGPDLDPPPLPGAPPLPGGLNTSEGSMGAPTPAPSTSETPVAESSAPSSPAPSSLAAPPAVASSPGEQGSLEQPPVATMVLIDIAVDRAYFDAVVSEGELTFPAVQPAAQRLEFAGPEIHIGRTSEGRAIHPDIDVAALTGDPAVSSRHAVVRVDPAGTILVTDVGSTNGTYIGVFDGSPVTPGVATLLTPGGVIYLGAWTSLTVTLVV